MARTNDPQPFRFGADDPPMHCPSTERSPGQDLAPRERWVAWVIRLMSHAATHATAEGQRARLEGAREDAEALREALAAAASGWLETAQVDIVHSVYDLWDANHDRNERLAALVDPPWHSRWRMRSEGARPARHHTAVEPILSSAGV